MRGSKQRARAVVVVVALVRTAVMTTTVAAVAVRGPHYHYPTAGLARRPLLVGAAAQALTASVVHTTAFAATPNQEQDEAVNRALREFERGDFDASLRSWVALTETCPSERLFWSNRGTVELILGSARAVLGERPTGEAERLLLAAVASFERAADLGDADALSLNNLGNALGVLLRWPEAADAYDRAAAAAAAAKTSASIMTQNRAQVALELGDWEGAERRAQTVLRKDPNFLDAKALLAAIKFQRGDRDGAEQVFAAICRPAVSAPNRFNPPTPGLGGTDWCEAYSSPSIVRGRWTPTAIEAFDAFLSSRSKNARIAANANPFLNSNSVR